MAVSPEERRYLLQQVSRLAEADLARLWARASELSTSDFAVFMIEAFPQLADPYYEMAADLAATWFELSDPASLYKALTATPVAVEQLASSAQWALGAQGDAALDRLQGTLQRNIFDGARETIVLNVNNTGSYWVRHARPEACAFCRMLATRSSSPRSWYSSNTSAIDVVGRRGRPRGNRAVGSRGYHDYCHCIAVEVRSGQEYTPPAYVEAWNEEMAKARANAGKGDPKSILSAWRQQGADIK